MRVGVTLAYIIAASSAAAASLDGTHVHGLAWDPADPERLLIATHHGLVALKGGELDTVSERRDDFMGFTVQPGGTGVFFASGHPTNGGNLGVIVSRDGGRTWDALSPGADGPVDFHQMDVSKADPKVMVGVYGAIQASRDGGRSWSIRGRAPAPVFGLALSATEPEKIYTATQAGLFASLDLGATWTRAAPSQAPATLVTTLPDGTVYVYDVESGLMRKPGGGNVFEPVAPPLRDDAILHLAVKDGGFAAATYKGALLLSTDGGRTWSPLVDR